MSEQILFLVFNGVVYLGVAAAFVMALRAFNRDVLRFSHLVGGHWWGRNRYKLPVVLSAVRYEALYILLLRARSRLVLLDLMVGDDLRPGVLNLIDLIDEVGDVVRLRRRYSGVGTEVRP